MHRFRTNKFTSSSSLATSQAAPSPTANTCGTVPLRMPLEIHSNSDSYWLQGYAARNTVSVSQIMASYYLLEGRRKDDFINIFVIVLLNKLT